MEANELMIGDWVMIENYSRICAIAEDGVYFADKDGRGATSFDRIELIPLTKDILEKNGFKRHWIAEKGSKRAEWRLSDDYYDIVVYEWSDSIWVFRYESCEMNIPHEQRTMGYLQELQHALRECGTDKEIII